MHQIVIAMDIRLKIDTELKNNNIMQIGNFVN